MKKQQPLALIAITLAAFTAKASDEFPYIAMPSGLGYAVDVKGARHSTAETMRNAVLAPSPVYPFDGNIIPTSPNLLSGDRIMRGSGMYRLLVSPSTGRVGNVITVKSTGHKALDDRMKVTFMNWRFKPNTWQQIDIPIVVKTRWVGNIQKVY